MRHSGVSPFFGPAVMTGSPANGATSVRSKRNAFAEDQPVSLVRGQAEEAAKFYVSVFKNSRITNISPYGASGPGPKGNVMTVEFELDGQPFMGLKGGPAFTITEAISMSVAC